MLDMNCLKVDVEGGYLYATISKDPNYPGICVEFVANDDIGQNLSRPSVLMEKPRGEDVRALVWNDKNDEDYTQEIAFR